jgi:hypothetical protein
MRHLLATAGGWGGFSTRRPRDINVNPGLPVGEHQLTAPADVPGDGLWSISLYNVVASSCPTTATPSAFKTLTANPGEDGMVPSTLADATTIAPTDCRLWTAATTSNGSTEPASLTAGERSAPPQSSEPPRAFQIWQHPCADTRAPTRGGVTQLREAAAREDDGGSHAWWTSSLRRRPSIGCPVNGRLFEARPWSQRHFPFLS